jgi:hypothetical protein
MSQEVNTATKGKFALIAGIFCALSGCCIGHTTGEAAGTSLVGAVIGFVVGYAGALMNPLLGFGLILISAIAFWHSYTVWAKPAPPAPPVTPVPRILTKEESRAELRKLREKLGEPVKAQQSPRPFVTPEPPKLTKEEVDAELMDLKQRRKALKAQQSPQPSASPTPANADL